MPISFLQIVSRPLFWPLLGLILVILVTDALHQPHFPEELSGGKKTWRGQVEAVKRSEDKQWVTVRLQPNAHRVRLTVLNHDNTVALQRGDILEFTTLLKEPVGYRNPGVFNYANYLRRQKVVATGFISNQGQWQVLSTVSNTNLFKQKIYRQLSALTTGPERDILIALLWGDENYLSEEITTLFREQGLAHLLVQSGSHFTLVAWLVFQAGLLIGRLFPALFIQLPFRKFNSVVTILLLTLYFLFCEPSPSLWRAFIVVTLYLVAQIINQQKDLWNLLFVAALVILLHAPGDLFSPSFQLSFGAVFALLYLLPHWPTQSILLKLFYASLATFIILAPLCATLFHELQPAGFWNNLWAIPVMEFFILPVGLIALVLALVSTTLSNLFFVIALWPLKQVVSILMTLNQFPTSFAVDPPHLPELALYYIFVLVLFSAWSWARKLITGSLLMVSLIIMVVWSLVEVTHPPELRLTHLDVGQGDALLIESPGPHRILIDAGGSPFFDIGNNVLLPYFQYRRIHRLDALVITHSDQDHFGGALSLVENMEIKELWWNGWDNGNTDLKNLLSVATSLGLPVKTWRDGDHVNISDTLTINFLSPDEADKNAKENNQSLVFKLESPVFTALFTGDIERIKERQLIHDFGFTLKSDYLKIPHHGSRSSSSHDFLEKVNPSLATLSTRKGNPFHHPHIPVLNLYKKMGVKVLRTDQLGAITIEPGFLRGD